MRRCKEIETGKYFAVKIIRSEDDEMFAHMQREFAILKRLNGHQNIIQGYEYIPEQQRWKGYLIMEEVFGDHILSKVVKNGRFPESTARTIFESIIKAIEYMHSERVVHRDLNPTNVFLTEENVIKILDFNVSKLVEGDQLGTIEEEGFGESPKFKFRLMTKTGTPIYTAPEMHFALRYTESVDMWGAGVILYVLLCGERPFNDTE